MSETKAKIGRPVSTNPRVVRVTALVTEAEEKLIRRACGKSPISTWAQTVLVQAAVKKSKC